MALSYEVESSTKIEIIMAASIITVLSKHYGANSRTRRILAVRITHLVPNFRSMYQPRDDLGQIYVLIRQGGTGRPEDRKTAKELLEDPWLTTWEITD
ncbi:hypothetical protein G3M48_010106 [Beauveria asiatica]|uniref:Uncharacterized protein n=1 Tax=Beauveria asiatica TaxID=1069075 RepID=A0AAW0RIC7_9HYPO